MQLYAKSIKKMVEVMNFADDANKMRPKDTAPASEDKYRMLVENSLQGLSIVQEGRFVFCNNALAELLGYSIEELLSLPDSLAVVHPDDRTVVRQRHLDRMEEMPVHPRHEHRLVRKDGTVRWVEVFASRMEYNGTPAMQVVSMDITAKLKAEAALRESREYLNQIINCIGDPIFVKDREHKFVLVNDALCALAGKPREELLGQALMPEEMLLPIWEKEEEVFATCTECLTEDTIVDGSGKTCIVQTRKSRLVDKNGNRQIVGVLRDISEYKRLEAQFLQSQKMEAIGVLAGGVAHDFNNLLNVINGYSEMVLDDLNEDDPIRKDLEQVRNAGRRASDLTSQLLAFGRKQMLQPKVLDLNRIINTMSSMLSRIIGEDIELLLETQSGLGMIRTDPAKLEQAIINLAVNARDAMPQGGKLIIETANAKFDANFTQGHPSVKAGSYILLAMSDNGIGMDAATKARIFEPFFTSKEKGRGTGLGLSTVYGIVKQSNGHIWVYSEPGEGTTFKIFFPQVEGETNSLSVEATKSVLSGSETVLLVEDEDAVRSLACRILRDRGYKVLEASGGEEALKIACDFDGDIHIVLTDAVMPGMNGNKLVPQLEEKHPGIKSLYMSGYTDSAVIQQGLLNSNIAFLQKPFTVEGLARKMREVLNV
jgi:two-component system, cell cycle sensor histidine kinase and response regulator CckA